MSRIALIHWNAEEIDERAERLRAAGHDPWAEPMTPAFLKSLRSRPPDALVIDLGRLPAQGRDVAVDLRTRKATRSLPLVFVDGAPEKVDRVKQTFPDAVYCRWRGVAGALKRAMTTGAKEPVPPAHALAGYSGTPLPKKLGVREGSSLALLGAPDGFERTLGALPEGVTLKRQARGKARVVLLFVRSEAELRRRFRPTTKAVDQGGSLWICWPKKASGQASDLGQKEVRRFGLERGWVDYKIAAIDATWSGLRFARRG